MLKLDIIWLVFIDSWACFMPLWGQALANLSGVTMQKKTLKAAGGPFFSAQAAQKSVVLPPGKPHNYRESPFFKRWISELNGHFQ